MQDPIFRNARNACSRCGADNGSEAKFCGQCGGPLGASSTARQAPQPPPRIETPPNPRIMDFRRFGGTSGGGNHLRVGMDASTAFDRLTRAIESAGGQIDWHSPPYSAKFTIGKRDLMNTGGVTIKYAGELTITPIDEGNSLIHLNLKVIWSSMVPILLGALLFSFFIVLLFPLFLPFLLLLVLVMAGYSAWFFASKMPADMGAKFLKGMPSATGSGTARSSEVEGYSYPDVSNPVANPATPRAGERVQATQSVTDRIRQLALLRDEGAITGEEYEAKKTQLLNEL